MESFENLYVRSICSDPNMNGRYIYEKEYKLDHEGRPIPEESKSSFGYCWGQNNKIFLNFFTEPYEKVNNYNIF